jgi:ribosome-associated heat shock protein Hsp15
LSVLSLKLMSQTDSRVCRLDKWLWAARFFKTRSIAADAVDSGKVRVDGGRAKNAKEIKIGMILSIKNKDFELEVKVSGLSNVRKGASEAALLYEETEESKLKRERTKVIREQEFAARDRGAGRPTKRQLREIKKFTGMKY